MDWGAHDTIVGVATAPGRGGVAILRISGKSSLQAGLRIFKNHDAASIESHRLYFGKFYHPDRLADSAATEAEELRVNASALPRQRVCEGKPLLIDEGFFVYMAAPHSYTGEATVELHGHGGEVAPRLLLEAALKIDGVRQAEPGEFTFRAFLNKKINLSQAEAVHEVVSSQNQLSHQLALAQLQGSGTKAWQDFQDRLVKLLSQFEADLDFPDEELGTSHGSERQAELQALIDELQTAIGANQWRKRASDTVKVLLAGPPNVGKSTLFNALLGESRAIVADKPGTTRDYLEARLNIRGVSVAIIDSAGLRAAASLDPIDPIEMSGMQRTRQLLESVDAVIWIDDPSTIAATLADDGAWRLLSDADSATLGSRPCLHLVNKADWLDEEQSQPGFISAIGGASHGVSPNTRYQNGLELVRDFVGELCAERLARVQSAGICVNERGEAALNHCLAALQEASRLWRGTDIPSRDPSADPSAELIAEQLWEAGRAIDELTGKSVSAEVVESIFKNFCIGK